MASGVGQIEAAVVQQQIGIAVLEKQLAATKQQGEAAVQLIEAASQLSKSLNTGQRLDLVG